MLPIDFARVYTQPLSGPLNRVLFLIEEVINPHDRARRAGTQPIYYEVVPVGTQAAFRVLYAPVPGKNTGAEIAPTDSIVRLVDAIAALVETYGISAKRTIGWGIAHIEKWTGLSTVEAEEQLFATKNIREFQAAIREWLAPTGGSL